MIRTFAFKYPWILLNLVWLPLWLWLAMRLWHAKNFIVSSSVTVFTKIPTTHPHKVPLICRFFALVCLVLALARPQGILETFNSHSNGVDMILAVDLSSSMQIPDFFVRQTQRASRIQAAKAVLSEFIQHRKHDRIGLVAFARYPYLVSPLTLNQAWLMKNLERLDAGMIEDGTAIGSAVTMAVNRLKELDAKTRIIILLTDGVNNFGDVSPALAAEAAKTFQTKIYTIMVGNDQVFPTDERTLVEMAETTGGRFYRAYDIRTLQEVYKEIDSLEKTEVKLEGFKTYSEFFPLFLGLCSLFLALEFFFKMYRYRVLS